jgi:hypothetical protein
LRDPHRPPGEDRDGRAGRCRTDGAVLRHHGPRPYAPYGPHKLGPPGVHTGNLASKAMMAKPCVLRFLTSPTAIGQGKRR